MVTVGAPTGFKQAAGSLRTEVRRRMVAQGLLGSPRINMCFRDAVQRQACVLEEWYRDRETGASCRSCLSFILCDSFHKSGRKVIHFSFHCFLSFYNHFIWLHGQK